MPVRHTYRCTPSSRPGLAGFSIAIDDTLSEPFTNPAKATRLKGFTLSTAPYWSDGLTGWTDIYDNGPSRGLHNARCVRKF